MRRSLHNAKSPVKPKPTGDLRGRDHRFTLDHSQCMRRDSNPQTRRTWFTATDAASYALHMHGAEALFLFWFGFGMTTLRFDLSRASSFLRKLFPTVTAELSSCVIPFSAAVAELRFLHSIIWFTVFSHRGKAGIRTRNHRDHNAALYQLSYRPTNIIAQPVALFQVLP